MKGWGEQLPSHRSTARVRAGSPPQAGSGLVRRDGTVLVPEAALRGDDAIEFAVLEDPATGTWFGEDPEHPGSAVIPLDPDTTIPTTPDMGAVLERVGSEARHLRRYLEGRSTAERAARARRLAYAAASTLPRPQDGALAIDLGRIAAGGDVTPCRWWRTSDGVRVETVRDDGDPTGWMADWRSDELLLVPDTAAGRRTAERLALALADLPRGQPDRLSGDVQRVATALLREVAPDILEALPAEAPRGSHGPAAWMASTLGLRYSDRELAASEYLERRDVSAIRAYPVDALEGRLVSAATEDGLAGAIEALLGDELDAFPWRVEARIVTALRKYGLLHTSIDSPPDDASGSPMWLELTGYVVLLEDGFVGDRSWLDVRPRDLGERMRTALPGRLAVMIDVATYGNVQFTGIGVPFYV